MDLDVRFTKMSRDTFAHHMKDRIDLWRATAAVRAEPAAMTIIDPPSEFERFGRATLRPCHLIKFEAPFPSAVDDPLLGHEAIFHRATSFRFRSIAFSKVQ